MKYRKNEGGTLVLVITCIMVIVIVGIGVFIAIKLMGGERELRHATDSGNLNVAKQALIKRVNLPAGTGATQFAGLGPTDTTIDLNTFNRSSAVTLLVLSNARQMQQSGNALSSAVSNANSVQAAWADLASSLAQTLQQQDTFQNSRDFEGLAQNNSTRMMSKAQNDVAHDRHKTSFTDRGVLQAGNTDGAANTFFAAGQLVAQPPSADALLINFQSRQYPKGYLQFAYDSLPPVFFVPLKNSGTNFANFNMSQPHHISTKTFTEDNRAVNGWGTPVPNAFLSRGQSFEKVANAQSMIDSCAVAQSTTPPTGFTAQIPRGFVRIINANCRNGGTIPPTGFDVYSFLMEMPVMRGRPAGTEPLTAYYDYAPGPVLDRIIAKNNNNEDPSAGDCNQLHPAAPLADCKKIKFKTAPITNNNVNTAELPAIADAFSVDNPQFTSNIPINVAGCLHALEQANQEFLAIRAAAPTHAYLNSGLNAFTSGVANVPGDRDAYSSCSNLSFTTPITMAEAIPESSAIYAQIVQRCRQILPTFNGNLDTVVGWNSLGIPMGSRSYIYFDGNVDRNTGAINGNLRIAQIANVPAWLSAIEGTTMIPVDGRVSHHRLRTVPVGNGVWTGNMTEGITFNHGGDCGYPLPYDFYIGNAAAMCVRDRFEYTPCTGFRGLLGEVMMQSCFGNNNCGGASQTEGTGPAPASNCRFESTSYFEGPC